MMEDDPVDCIRLAFDETGEPVGMVSGIVIGSGRAYVCLSGLSLVPGVKATGISYWHG